MGIRRYKFCFPVIISMLLLSFIAADENEEDELFVCDKIPSMRTIFSYRGGKGLSYSSGYASYGLFYTPISPTCDLVQPFVDARYHWFHDGKIAFNLGAGARYYSQSLDTVVGTNFYYDYRKDHKDFHQVGFGLEWLASLFDARINGYIPVGKQKFSTNPHVIISPAGDFVSYKKNQDALAGFDAELSTSIGKWVESDAFDIFAAIGAYFYRSRGYQRGDNIIGGRFRFGAEINEFVTLEASMTYDSVFKVGAQGLVMLIIPFGFFSEEKFNSNISFMKDTARERPIRNEILLTNQKYRSYKPRNGS